MDKGSLMEGVHRHVAAFSLMASTCLATMFQALEIVGVPYWDGG